MGEQAQVRAVRRTLERYVGGGLLPGGVVLIRRQGQVHRVAVGKLGTEPDAPPLEPDVIVRLASMTKPITAAAALILVDDKRMTLESPIDRWLPELSAARVVRTPEAAVDDVVPLARPVIVEDLLTSRSGWGFAPDFSLPAGQALFPVQRDGRRPHDFPAADLWLRELAQVPMLAQPGTTWLYDTSLAILGILVERVSGVGLEDFLAERIFAPLDMADAGFSVPVGKMDRFAHFFRGEAGNLVEADDRSAWTVEPTLKLGNGGLVGTADDWYRFANMLLQHGDGPTGPVMSGTSVDAMTTNWLSPQQRSAAGLFLDGQGWGFGGSVDVVAHRPWERPGRYGWVGGTGTSGHLYPATGDVTILLTQVAADRPGLLDIYEDVWTAAS